MLELSSYNLGKLISGKYVFNLDYKNRVFMLKLFNINWKTKKLFYKTKHILNHLRVFVLKNQ